MSPLSSDPSAHPAQELDATLEFEVIDSDTFTLRVTNDTSAPDPTFDINQVLFNATFASDNVADLDMTAAVHSVEGDMLAGGLWTLLETDGGNQGPTQGGTHADGFGIHDFLLRDGNGVSSSMIGPGENVLFTFDVLTASGFLQSAFTTQLSAQVPPPNDTNILTYAVAKFVNGYDGCPISEGGPGGCYSAFGATAVPEPTTALLLLGGLSGLALCGRRRLH